MILMLGVLSLATTSAQEDSINRADRMVIIGGFGIAGELVPREARFWKSLASSNATSHFSTLITSTSPVSRAYAAIALSLLEPLSISNTISALSTDTNSVLLVTRDIRSPTTVGGIAELAIRHAFDTTLVKHEECRHLLLRNPRLEPFWGGHGK